jgi:hypothetical protein
LHADENCNIIIGFVSRAYNAISNKGRLKTNRIIDMVKTIPQVLPVSKVEEGKNQSTYKIVDISQL